MNTTIKDLKLIANTLRKDIIEIAYKAEGPSHPGSALSCTDIITALYFKIMTIDPENPQWEERDRFILSKGHACPVLYAALSERGFFSKEWLYTIRHMDSRLQGHPDMTKTPGVDMTSGSLGNGLSIALGMAIYLKHRQKSSHIFCLLGDGEIQEGLVWEAAISAPVLGADNLTAIIDANHFQSCGAVAEILPVRCMNQLWGDCGWNVLTINGHSMEEIVSALEVAKNFRGKPTCIIANTVKGKGVSFMESDNSWHQRTPTEDQYKLAIKELEENGACL